jgi:pimeloyl-ACP methyl ester carboxylesterase
MGYVHLDGCRLYYEDAGEGVPILLIHPAGSTASTWGAAADELARIGHLITYDRRGYARSGGEAVRSMSTHTADAAALLQHLRAPRAVVVGTSAGAAIVVDLAVRCPNRVRAVIAHEFPWRFARHLPSRYGVRSPNGMVRLVQSLAAAIPTAATRRIEGAGHASPFDSTTNFVDLVAEAVEAREARELTAAR